MKDIICILLCRVWLSAALNVYHEQSMKVFGHGIMRSASFGYSITYTPNNKRLIVSAPKATDRGNIFTCNIDKSQCDLLTTKIEAQKNFQILLGATVKAGSNFFVTCAPRFLDTESNKIASRCYNYGLIKTKKGTRDEFIMLTQPTINSKKRLKDEQKMLTFGWSMDVHPNNDILIGGPAMYTGRAVKYDHPSTNKNTPLMILPVNSQVESNFGYSVLFRQYNGTNQLVISSTYGEHGSGMVFIFKDKTGEIIYTIRGFNVGLMFGASLCAAKVDGNGQALLLISAPTYASQNMYNTGIVFIYKDNRNNLYRVIKGTKNGGQFGYAMANLGDLNGDSKDEIAVSAPYEDEGVVYIYSGTHLIDKDKEITWLQRIHKKGYRSFGLSLYALPDFDENGCKELAIGIPQNDTAVLFSCLAAITVKVKPLKPMGKINHLPGFLSFKYESCLAFQYPHLPKIIDASFDVSLSISKVQISLLRSRVMANDSITYKVQVTPQKEYEYCEKIIISVSEIETYDPTLYYHISAKLLNDPRNQPDFKPSRVTVTDLSVLMQDGTAWIHECKNREKCVPKLTMLSSSSMSNPYVVGSSENETLSISVDNKGEPAYEACVKIYLHGIDSLSSWPSSCMIPSNDDDEEDLICSPKYLLKYNTQWEINNITLDTRSIKTKEEGGDGYFRIKIHLHDYCSSNASSSIKEIIGTIPLQWDSENVTVMGLIKHGGLINVTRNEIEHSSKEIQHEYEINNKGPTTWYNVKVIIALQKEFYLGDIHAFYGVDYECIPNGETEKKYLYQCKITTLRRYMKFFIVLPIVIKSNIYDTLTKKEQKVISHIKIYLDEVVKSCSITSTLRYSKLNVPLWIIFVAALIGLFIIGILVFILYECGFLRRKKKDDLSSLRRSVQRQSMRRTTMIDTARLIDPEMEDSVEANTSVNGEKNVEKDSYQLKTAITPIHTENQNETKEVKEKPEESSENKMSSGKEVTPITSHSNVETNTDVEQCVKAKGRNGKNTDPLANIIIGGLQKNLRSRDALPSVEE